MSSIEKVVKIGDLMERALMDELSTTIIVVIDEPLSSRLEDLYEQAKREAPEDPRYANLHVWLLEILKDKAYGDGHPWPEERA